MYKLRKKKKKECLAEKRDMIQRLWVAYMFS